MEAEDGKERILLVHLPNVACSFALDSTSSDASLDSEPEDHAGSLRVPDTESERLKALVEPDCTTRCHRCRPSDAREAARARRSRLLPAANVNSSCWARRHSQNHKPLNCASAKDDQGLSWLNPSSMHACTCMV